MIGVVDYEAGNIASVSNALASIGVDFVVSGDRRKLEGCSGIILPGVGAAPGAMRSLEQKQLTGLLKAPPVPLLGICLGMQLLYERSEEGTTNCLGALDGTVRRFGSETSKIPHMGWNAVDQQLSDQLFSGIPQGAFFYFAHSYYAPVDRSSISATTEGVPFASAIHDGRFYGVQFHPEKSGPIGLRVLKNFAAVCK
ncbi:MAG TPA: imidazole glycerol phosphate synthase subunit HisH [Bacteroidota bacterium]|nr:imidazole glycerol phosphate synthase subunit HisH [Bacteroidota bacterium]